MTREEAINDLNTIKEFFEQESGAYPVSLEYAIEVLKNEPSSDNQAKWVRADTWCYGMGMGEVYGYYYRCDKCNEEVLEESNYCPHCGARMKGADDE